MLENKCRTCGRDLDSGFNCPVCSNKTMTTPTKEQIDWYKKIDWSKIGGKWRGKRLYYKALELICEKIREK